MDDLAKPVRMHLLFAAISLFAFACSGDNPGSQAADSGTFTLLTYNVAGLPPAISSSNPEKNIPIMSPLLNKYDIVLVQEDFFYHNELALQAKHSTRSAPKAGPDNFRQGDGLNRFSKFPFDGHIRQAWRQCSNESGNDCLARKGFSFARTEIAPGFEIDIYNTHNDAGGTEQDTEARRQQIEQLLSEIASRSSGRAVIVAGDFNLNLTSRPADLPLFQRLTSGAGLSDACNEAGCTLQLVDRVLFRSSDNLELSVNDWKIDEDFVDETGSKLSDHFAVAVDFSWSVGPPK